jgi:hypothetical protein
MVVFYFPPHGCSSFGLEAKKFEWGAAPLEWPRILPVPGVARYHRTRTTPGPSQALVYHTEVRPLF